jgi:hypothetical protein
MSLRLLRVRGVSDSRGVIMQLLFLTLLHASVEAMSRRAFTNNHCVIYPNYRVELRLSLGCESTLVTTTPMNAFYIFIGNYGLDVVRPTHYKRHSFMLKLERLPQVGSAA